MDDVKDDKNKSVDSSSSGSTDDGLSSVLQLHNNDIPGNMLVGEILTTSNYDDWVIDMKDTLVAKKKYCFVDGSLPKPKYPIEMNAGLRCDAMVKG
ncbi:unnamed protein product [Linum trigynum]|uniref:Retrotransposon Copia-like N-terminal domain-containing protein n=1 Tax=Linum trigynum TaxID=586398 RepID=A0AAV2CSC9_9ROSI